MSFERRYQSFARRARQRFDLIAGSPEWPVAEIACAVDHLQRQAGVTGNVAEIGLYEGKFLYALSEIKRAPERLIGVDIGDDPERWAALGEHLKLAVNLDLIRQDSRQLSAVDYRKHGGVRIFSVDGGHDYETACHDFRAASASLTPGGVLIIDDIFAARMPEVTEAFFDSFGGGDWCAIALGWSNVFVCRRESHRLYFPHVRNLVNRAFRDRSMFGLPCACACAE